MCQLKISAECLHCLFESGSDVCFISVSGYSWSLAFACSVFLGASLHNLFLSLLFEVFWNL